MEELRSHGLVLGEATDRQRGELCTSLEVTCFLCQDGQADTLQRMVITNLG